MTNSIVPWSVSEVELDTSLRGAAIVQKALLLTSREKRQVTSALEAGSFEMVTNFVWQRTIGALRKQLALLGADFVGEMLERPDITEQSSLDQKVTDFETLRLAQDLGMVTPLDSLRLRQTLEKLVHFHESEDDEGMAPVDAEGCMFACVKAVLARPNVEVAGGFAELRQALEHRTFTSSDGEVRLLAESPTFFQRTTLSMLLARIRRAEGAPLEHILSNTSVLLPIIWPNLRKPEKWQTGAVYAEVHAAGRQLAAAGLKRALMQVKGFDFVPENLRSRSFIEAANALIQAHEGWNNFQAEEAPAAVLASLGTTIPPPAIKACVSAALCSKLGNLYGPSYSAEPYVDSIIRGLSSMQWEYYLMECLEHDKRILEKLTENRTARVWCQLCREFDLGNVIGRSGMLSKLLRVSMANDFGAVMGVAKGLLLRSA